MSDDTNVKIRIIPNGPYRVDGAALKHIRLLDGDDGRPEEWQDGDDVETDDSYSLCRCGASANKPFCDGAHRQIDFDGSETADRAPSADRRKVFEGDGIAMSDDKSLCYHAGLCVAADTTAWKLVGAGDDPASRERLVGMIQACPSGRLQYHAAPDGPAVEPDLPEDIAVVDDGPLWVRGGIPVEGADGEIYEVRNRVTLCRCGASANKPFCDGAHSKADPRDP